MHVCVLNSSDPINKKKSHTKIWEFLLRVFYGKPIVNNVMDGQT